MKNEVIIPGLLDWTRDRAEISALSLRKEALYREIVRERGIAALPGVEAWLGRLRAAGIPCAIASSTHRENITVTLDVLGLKDFFSALVTAEDVTKGKPDPEVFLTAAKRLDVAPARAVVFEGRAGRDRGGAGGGHAGGRGHDDRGAGAAGPCRPGGRPPGRTRSRGTLGEIMRRDINWTTKRDDGSRYDVRITWFSGRFKFQFKERGADRWDYDRLPSPEDLETFLDAIDRRYTASRRR